MTYEEILVLKQKGEIIVMGDFNARTGLDDDIIKFDKFDNIDIANINFNNDIAPRNSEDKLTSNHRGKQLIELCKALKLAILNGRKNGDLFGAYTSFQWNGNSVVDYALSTYSMFHKIEYLAVGNYIPWISDHCALHIRLNFSVPKKLATPVKDTKNEIYKSFYWDENSNVKFNRGLEKCENELEQIMNVPVNNTRTISTLFTNMVYKITKMENIKLKIKRKPTNQKWFDNECIKEKQKIKHIGKCVKKEPENIRLREGLNDSKRIFRKLTNVKKGKYRENLVKTMHLSKGEGKKFWKSLDKLDFSKNMNDYVDKISIDSWREHFNSIYCDEQEPIYPPDCNDEGPLDHEITMEELIEASYVLKNDKSCGIDMISNEILKCILQKRPHILLKLYNSALENNIAPPDWITAIISPIHKKGSKMVRDNYRGISLISCVYKLFSAILNNRLWSFCKSRNILSEEQLGFIPGNRTSDAHFIIHNLQPSKLIVRLS